MLPVSLEAWEALQPYHSKININHTGNFNFIPFVGVHHTLNSFYRSTLLLEFVFIIGVVVLPVLS